MQKIIKIGEKEYSMKASAFTQFAYKNETGRSFLSDLKKLSELKGEDSDVDKLDNVMDLILQVSYVMIRESNESQVTNFESFLKGIDDLYSDPSWIEEVITLAISPISRQLQKN